VAVAVAVAVHLRWVAAVHRVLASGLGLARIRPSRGNLDFRTYVRTDPTAATAVHWPCARPPARPGTTSTSPTSPTSSSSRGGGGQQVWPWRATVDLAEGGGGLRGCHRR
jgi:hypothetical protein